MMIFIPLQTQEPSSRNLGQEVTDVKWTQNETPDRPAPVEFCLQYNRKVKKEHTSFDSNGILQWKNIFGDLIGTRMAHIAKKK